MAGLDMSDVITDLDLCEPPDGTLQLVRLTQTVSAAGLATDAEATTSISGVVCAKDGKSIDRSDASEEAYESITVHTLTPVTAGNAANIPADLIVWHGNRYTVVNVNSFSNFGAGFYAVECELLSVQGGA